MADNAKILKAVKDKKAALDEQERMGREWGEQVSSMRSTCRSNC